jgi:hypothetical protein
MSFNAVCPKCSMVHVLPDDRDGRETRCMRCATPFISDHDPAVQRMERPSVTRRAESTRRSRRALRRLLKRAAAAVLLSALLGAGAYAAYRSGLFEPRVSRQTFTKLSVGMTEAEVRKLLGPPTRVDDSQLDSILRTSQLEESKARQVAVRKLFWEDGDRQIWVDIRGGAVEKIGGQFGGAEPVPEGGATPGESALVK